MLKLRIPAASGTITTTQSSYQPVLDQLFFIGDGLTGTGGGQQQQFVVPAGATALWLGVADAGYYQGDRFRQPETQVVLPQPFRWFRPR